MKEMMLFMSILAISCNSSDDNNGATNCTDIFVYGLNVTVKDSLANEILQEGVIVKAVDGIYEETLQSEQSTSAVFVGAGERAGNYVLTVSKPGYETYTSGVITLTADECHVIPKEVAVALVAE